MNIHRVAEIVTLIQDLTDVALGGNLQQEIAAAVILLKIVRKGIQAYQEHTGHPIDLSLIKPEEPV